MDGTFMRKLWKRVFFCWILTIAFWTGTLIADKQTLSEELIRFHVIAASDGSVDQNIKLQVRDAVLKSISQDLQHMSDVEEAKRYLQENIPKLESIANKVLSLAGMEDQAQVSLCKEAFGVRQYDTFSLPAGIYESLKIVIGKGEGENWWCVAFPSLCLPATRADFEAAAVSAGFSKPLAKTLTNKSRYQFRFFLLDAIGKIENKWITE